MEMFSYFPSECKKKEERKKDKCRIEDCIVLSGKLFDIILHDDFYSKN